MKKMTCKQLGVACDLMFEAETFDDMVEISKKHGGEMFQKGDTAHLDVMKEMQKLMQEPQAMQAWFEEKRKLFASLPAV